MAQDPRFARNSDRIAHRDELEEMLAARFKSATAAEWIAKIQALKVPAGPINDIAQALAEPQVAARQMIVNIPHPQNGKFQMIGSPIKLSDTCVSYTNAAPMLGQHTNAVLGEQLGLSDACLDALATSGVISRIPT
jgi:crotonobetainyl-CoA:carnitine CoA-transferase CaiB-like acyl-CoA transferase